MIKKICVSPLDGVIPSVYSEALTYIEQLNEVIEKINEITEVTNEWSDKLTEYDEEIAKINADYAEIKTKFDGITEILAVLSGATSDLSDSVEEINAKIDEINTALESIKTRITALETDNATNKSDITNIKNNIETIESSVTALEGADKVFALDIQQLKADNTTNKNSITTAQSDINSLYDITEATDATVETMNADISKLNTYSQFPFTFSSVPALFTNIASANCTSFPEYEPHAVGDYTYIVLANLTCSQSAVLICYTTRNSKTLRYRVQTSNGYYYIPGTSYHIDTKNYCAIPLSKGNSQIQLYEGDSIVPFDIANYTVEIGSGTIIISGSVTSPNGTVRTIGDEYNLAWAKI